MDIVVTEVGPRDGLQNEPETLAPTERLEFIRLLVAAGLKRIEAVSFVNPGRIPQMAGAEEIVAGLPDTPDVRFSGLALNGRGIERALATRIDAVHCTVAVSDAFNERNAGRSTNASVDSLAGAIRAASKERTFVAILGTAFGCPYQGVVEPSRVMEVAGALLDAGCTELTLADTTGVAVPSQVRSLVKAVRKQFGTDLILGLHFHNTRGLGLANAYAGALEGVSYFDSSVAGVGGCPFAPKAVGNVCTEDMVNMFEGNGWSTGLSINRLLAASRWLERRLDRTLPGMLMKVGG